jgi:hypothetical protein
MFAETFLLRMSIFMTFLQFVRVQIINNGHLSQRMPNIRAEPYDKHKTTRLINK